MIFDKFCAVVERHFPELELLAREAKVFMFNKPAHSIRPGDTQPEDFDMFALPFPCTVIEDPGTAVLLFDTEDNQIGVNGRRLFIDMLPMLSDVSNFGDSMPPEKYGDLIKARVAMGIDHTGLTLTFGEFSQGTPENGRLRASFTATRVVQVTKDKVHVDMDLVSGAYDTSTKYTMAVAVATNVVAAIEELISIYTRKHFVLETAPLSPKTHPKKIPRTHQRPMYTILDARTIRTKMGTLAAHEKELEEGRKRNSPIPHERRRHPRRLSTAGGHYKEDKVIIIPAMWIGESEKVVGNKKYKVRLDI